MPTPADIVRVAINAVLPGGEQLVHTFHVKDVRNPGSLVGADLDVLAQQVAYKWQDFLGREGQGGVPISGHMSNGLRYKTVNTYKIGADGKAEAQGEGTFSANQGGSSTSALPTEVALCCTTRTGSPGRSNRGRLYLGGLANEALAADGKVRVGLNSGIAIALAQFFRDVRDIDVSTGQQDKWEPHVASFTHGTSRKITAVAVGDVFDVQRRRRTGLVESYSTDAVD